MGSCVFPVGSRVRVVSYGPFRGLRGTIRTVDLIADDDEDPSCFYHIVLDGSQIKQPIWFTYDEVELVAASAASVEEFCRAAYDQAVAHGGGRADRPAGELFREGHEEEGAPAYRGSGASRHLGTWYSQTL